MIISFFCHQKDMEGTGYTKIYIFTKLPDSKVWISEYVVLLWYDQSVLHFKLFFKFKSYYLVCTYICVLLKRDRYTFKAYEIRN